MNRDHRAAIAAETLAICAAGSYASPAGARVDIADALRDAVAGSMLYQPDDPPLQVREPRFAATRLEVANESTFDALRRLAPAGGRVACLNFASAKNPGGGFRTGAQAQEEALARASGLYPCLVAVPVYYDRHRANRSALYLDLAIWSPRVPFFRDDDGMLLDEPVAASVITSAAPNAGAVRQNEPANVASIAPTLARRAELVLAVAAAQRVDTLVLGAWGCGVFRNDPAQVAATFATLLAGTFDRVFRHVAFGVLDRSDGGTYRAFARRFGPFS